MSLSDVPPEVIHQCLCFLTSAQCLRVRLVNRTFNEAASSAVREIRPRGRRGNNSSSSSSASSSSSSSSSSVDLVFSNADIQELLSQFVNLESIDLSLCKAAGDRVLTFIAQHYPKTLRYLDISNNRGGISEKGIAKVLTATTESSFSELVARNLRIDASTVLLSASSSPNLRKIDLSDTVSLTLQTLITALDQYPQLTRDIRASHLVRELEERLSRRLAISVLDLLRELYTLSPVFLQHLCNDALAKGSLAVLEFLFEYSPIITVKVPRISTLNNSDSDDEHRTEATDNHEATDNEQESNENPKRPFIPSLDVAHSLLIQGDVNVFAGLRAIMNFSDEFSEGGIDSMIPPSVVQECLVRGHEQVLAMLRVNKYTRWDEISPTAIEQALLAGQSRAVDQLISCNYHNFDRISAETVRSLVSTGNSNAIVTLRAAKYDLFPVITTEAITQCCLRGHAGVLSHLRLADPTATQRLVANLPLEVVIEVVRRGHSGMVTQLRLCEYPRLCDVPSDAIGGQYKIKEQLRLAANRTPSHSKIRR